MYWYIASSKQIHISSLALKVSGKIKWFDSNIGYGFITRDDKLSDVFIHRNAILSANPQRPVRNLLEGQRVLFDVIQGNKGPEAANVSAPDGGPLRQPRWRPYGGFRRNNENFEKIPSRSSRQEVIRDSRTPLPSNPPQNRDISNPLPVRSKNGTSTFRREYVTFNRDYEVVNSAWREFSRNSRANNLQPPIQRMRYAFSRASEMQR